MVTSVAGTETVWTICGSGSGAAMDQEKTCPFCAEQIPRVAVKCPFCRSDLPPDPVSPTPALPSAHPPTVARPPAIPKPPNLGPPAVTTPPQPASPLGEDSNSPAQAPARSEVRTDRKWMLWVFGGIALAALVVAALALFAATSSRPAHQSASNQDDRSPPKTAVNGPASPPTSAHGAGTATGKGRPTVTLIGAPAHQAEPVPDPKAAAEANRRGAKLSAERHYDEAIKEFDEAIRLDPRMTGAWANRAHALLRLGRLDDAADAVSKVLELSTVPKTRAVALLALGYASARRGHVQQAEGAYQRALAEYPSYSAAKDAQTILRLGREPSSNLVVAIEAALAGQPVTEDLLLPLSREEKVILVAAPRARHGLPLEPFSVASFFYSSSVARKLKLKEDPSATDDVLLPEDRENLRMLRQSQTTTKGMQKDVPMADPFQP